MLTGTMHLPKQRRGSKWHQDSSITARMAKHVEQQNIIKMQCAGAAKQAEEKRKIIVRLIVIDEVHILLG